MKLLAEKHLISPRSKIIIMKKIKSYAAVNSSSPLEPYDIERRECNAEDVLIKIEYSI